MEIKEIFSKVKEQATYAADVASQKGKEVLNSSKAGLKTLDLNSEIEAIYKELGKLAYQSRKGIEVSEEAISFKIAEIDRRYDEIAKIKSQAEATKTTTICPNCSTTVKKEDKFCAKCGMNF